MTSLIRFQNVGFRYGDSMVLDDISLDVSAGEIYGLVGADGAGKTTLLRLAVGQLTLSQGTISILGRPPASPSLRDDIAYMPQGFGLYPDLSVQENLDFFADLHGLAAEVSRPRISDMLERTGLKGFETRRSGNLSGGMMQKLALSCALVSQPKVMFLDEATTGVDPVSRRAFWRLLDGVRAEGVAILYATANMDEAERCDRVGMLDGGRLTRQGAPETLIADERYQLISVSGADARKQRTAIGRIPGVRLAFPVGRQVNVWIDADHGLEALQDDLDRVAPGLRAEPAQPRLKDAALRNMALAGP